MRSPKDEGSQFSKIHFPLNKEERLVPNFFFREYNLYFKKTLNPFKVVYHPVSCLLHLHITLWTTAMVQMTARNKLVDTGKDWWLSERLVTLGKTSFSFVSVIRCIWPWSFDGLPCYVLWLWFLPRPQSTLRTKRWMANEEN